MSETREAVLSAAEKLISRPSENPPGDEAAVTEWLTHRFENSPVEFDVSTEPVASGRPNVVARGGDPKNGTVLLTGHTDVVPADPAGWTSHPYEPEVRDGRLFGRGSADMKGALAAMIVGAERYLERTEEPGEVVLAFVVDEEHAGTGTQALVESGVDADLAVVGEPTDLDVCTAIKGVARYEVTVQGESCHSGMPDEGRDAIRGAAELVERVAALDADLETTSHAVLAHEDVTVTELESGLAPNVVAPDATATIDWRFLPGQTDPVEFDERIAARIEDLAVDGPAFDVDVERTVFARAGETAPEDPSVRAAIEAVRSVGAPGDVVGFNAATDARFLIHDAELPTVHFGPGSLSDDAHTVDESVAVEDLLTAVDGYEAILDSLV